MLIAFKGENGGSVRIDEDDPWADEPTAVIPNHQLELLREVMDPDEDRPTARLLVVREEALAAGSATELPQATLCAKVSAFPRARERSVTASPAAPPRGGADRAFLVVLGLGLLAIQILALGS